MNRRAFLKLTLSAATLACIAPGKALSVITSEADGVAYHNIPEGWLVADGSTLDAKIYADLFAAVGNMYNSGGEPSDTFRLPDLRLHNSAAEVIKLKKLPKGSFIFRHIINTKQSAFNVPAGTLVEALFINN